MAADTNALKPWLLGDEVNGGFIRDLCFTVWSLGNAAANRNDGSVHDWANDTLPTVQAGVAKIRQRLASRPEQQNIDTNAVAPPTEQLGSELYRRNERATNHPTAQVTDAMVEAGAEAITKAFRAGKLNSVLRPEAAREIYLAMLTASPRQTEGLVEALRRIGFPKDTERTLMPSEMRIIAQDALALLNPEGKP